MKYFFIVGEASGDTHAANLIAAISKKDEAATFVGWGGDNMKKNGVVILKHIRELAFMGFVQVVKNINTILGNFKLIKKQILEQQPDVIVLVDYPGFNLRMAEWAKENNFKVIYYIAPQAWAWKESRVEKIKKYVDKLICILPFEKKFFEDRGMPVEYVGHPSLEGINIQGERTENVIALLPGSRKQEVKSMLPIMLEVANKFPENEFVIAKSPTLDLSFYDDFSTKKNVSVSSKGTADLLSKANAALVTSGTATLEAALYNVPQVVCYKSGSLSYMIAKKLIKVSYISLVNLIADKEVVKELIQDDLNVEQLEKELKNILSKSSAEEMKNEYQQLRKLLGEGTASEKAAEVVVGFVG